MGGCCRPSGMNGSSRYSSSLANQAFASNGASIGSKSTLRPIRRILPNLGGIDVSPVILILIILLIENIIVRYIYPNVF